MRVAVLDDYHRIAHTLADWGSLGVEVAFFDQPLAREQLPGALAEFDTLVLMRERTAFPREVLERLPGLELVVTTGMRNAALDVDYLRERGVRVCGTGIPGYGASDPLGPGGGGPGGGGPGGGGPGGGGPGGVASTTEVTWALILALFKRVAWEDRAIRQGIWQQGLPSNLAGATLGLAGLGRLGAQMVGPARAFGMEVIAWSENLTAERAAAAGATCVGRDELLESSDVLSIHLVLSGRTRGLIGAAELALMKPTAFLVNTSRGPIVDESALVAALRSGEIAGAGLDVFAVEPLPSDSELPGLDNVVLTPHLGYVSAEGLSEMYGQVVEDIAAHLRGEPIRVIA
ncbi:MAG: D-2-hydroxyacid dehydrogenase family protein [Conexibacteraceae bacterium]|nr:D-2-hydroxyacid dehydrogenase family protein [Conexibacteraceae bacterium]